MGVNVVPPFCIPGNEGRDTLWSSSRLPCEVASKLKKLSESGHWMLEKNKILVSFIEKCMRCYISTYKTTEFSFRKNIKCKKKQINKGKISCFLTLGDFTLTEMVLRCGLGCSI